jgi:hypothetical protein
MNSKELFINAIDKLRQRNQAYVNKAGENRFSHETDEIIYNLVTWFNNVETEKQQSKDYYMISQKLYHICLLFGIKPDDLLIIPIEFLKNQLIYQELTEALSDIALFIIDLHFHSILIRFLAANEIFENLVLPNLTDITNDNLNQFLNEFYARIESATHEETIEIRN